MLNVAFSIISLVAEDSEEFDPTTVTPGPNGFFWTFLVAGIAVLLILDMARRMRRNNLRERAREDLLAEAQQYLSEHSESGEQTGTIEGQEQSTDPSGTQDTDSAPEN